MGLDSWRLSFGGSWLGVEKFELATFILKDQEIDSMYTGGFSSNSLALENFLSHPFAWVS